MQQNFSFGNMRSSDDLHNFSCSYGAPSEEGDDDFSDPSDDEGGFGHRRKGYVILCTYDLVVV